MANSVVFGIYSTREQVCIKGGCILLSVHADDSEWIRKAKKILERTGAEDIASTGETKGDYANMDKPKDRMRA